MEFNGLIALAAGVIGLLVGLTGVGAGALMTPLLIVGFGVSPAVAIATDLLYASLTKVAGGLAHLRHGGVQWAVLRRLWIGGLIGVGLGVVIVFSLLEVTAAQDLLLFPLGAVLLVAAGSLLFRGLRRQEGIFPKYRQNPQLRATATLTGGAGIGMAVSLTSVGAGALGMALLTRVSPPGTPPRALVGTDLLFAVPIALTAGLFYFFGGLVDLSLLVNLLVGSLPGVLIGSTLAGVAPARLLNVVIGLALVAAALTMLSSAFVA